MRTRKSLLLAAAAGVALLALAPAARGQAMTLRFTVQPGDQRVYEHVVRTETIVQAGDKSRKTVTEVPLKREELIVDTKADPASMRVVLLETPVGERIVALEENGIDTLGKIAEANRVRPLPPALSSQWRLLTGRPAEDAKVDNATRALGQFQAEITFLPEQPVKPGDTWTREVDLGVAKAVITTKYVEQKADGNVPAAILESTATVQFTGDTADKIRVSELSSRMAWATDGSGWTSLSGTMSVHEKADQAEQTVIRRFREQRTSSGRIDAPILERARKDLEGVENALKQAQADDLDGAVETLGAIIRENPRGPWAPAFQNLHAGLTQRRLMTQPVSAPRLRLMLRDLQTARDQAGSQGGASRVMQVDQTLRQIVKVNLKTVLSDAVEPDPVIRDLAAFGLAFADTSQAADRLKSLAKDDSPQVRGTAIVGLALQGKALDGKALQTHLQDKDERIRGAAALLASRTVKSDEPLAATLLPVLIENLKLENVWSRLNTLSAIAALAPNGAVDPARALLEGYKAEKEERMKPVYLRALGKITGVEAETPAPYEQWLKRQPGSSAPKG